MVNPSQDHKRLMLRALSPKELPKPMFLSVAKLPETCEGPNTGSILGLYTNLHHRSLRVRGFHFWTPPGLWEIGTVGLGTRGIVEVAVPGIGI